MFLIDFAQFIITRKYLFIFEFRRKPIAAKESRFFLRFLHWESHNGEYFKNLKLACSSTDFIAIGRNTKTLNYFWVVPSQNLGLLWDKNIENRTIGSGMPFVFFFFNSLLFFTYLSFWKLKKFDSYFWIPWIVIDLRRPKLNKLWSCLHFWILQESDCSRGV